MTDPSCICREWIADSLIVEPGCPAKTHGPQVTCTQPEVIVDKKLYRPAPDRRACYKVETSYGDDRPGWFVYRRVRASIAGYTECHRFETRSDGMRAMYLADPIATPMLLQQTPIPETEWEQAWERWLGEVSEPWGVE